MMNTGMPNTWKNVKQKNKSMIISVYLLLTYLTGALMLVMTLEEEKMLKVNDIIMLILSPFSIIPVVVIHIVSHFVDVDAVLYKK